MVHLCVPKKIIIFKILYVGNNQHKGTTSKPREFVIDDLIIPQPDSEEHYRVQVNIFKIYNIFK